MKVSQIKIYVVAAISLFASSCGTSRKVIEAQNIAIQQELDAMREQQAKPTRTVRKLDPCEMLALQESDYFRAAGAAIAKNLTEAKSGAATDARNQLAQMIRVFVNGTSQDHSKNNASVHSISSVYAGEELLNQYVYQSVEFTKPIKWSMYDLSNGMVEVYVCMEMTKKPEDITIDLQSRMQQVTLSGGGLLGANIRTNPSAEALFQEGKEDCVSHNHDLGIPKLMQAIELGSVNAMHYVGLMYLYGDNVEQDSKLAFQYLLSAANSGNREAIFQVAEMYNSGTGTPKDKSQARYWYRRADKLGDSRAESRLRRL